jgi:long-chain fatty acid transport protein
MPSLAMVWGSEESKHTFGVSAFGISGFGVTFPENMANPINAPQNMGGFGHVESDYMLLQIGFTWAYEFADNLSFGIEPTINIATLEMAPNPLAMPSMTLGYPESDQASAVGFGAQFGLFYASDGGFKLGVSHKTNQSFDAFKFNNTYLDGTNASANEFQMDYPAITSFGMGVSKEKFDIAVDYRMVNYDGTEGFEKKGWTQFGTVQGFGWEDITIVSVGLQLKLIEKLPLRFGYTYSDNPINPDLAFFSVPATAIIENAYQFGFSYPINDKLMLNGLYHHGESGDKTEGPLMNPMMASPSNRYGSIPGTTVGYEMTTDMVMFGLTYTFAKK